MDIAAKNRLKHYGFVHSKLLVSSTLPGSQMTVSKFPSAKSFLLIFSSEPLLNRTPCGNMTAIVLSLLNNENRVIEKQSQMLTLEQDRNF